MLEGLGLTPDQFVDLCILCGCDYCGTIKGTVPSPNVINVRADKFLSLAGIKYDLLVATATSLDVSCRHRRGDGPEADPEA